MSREFTHGYSGSTQPSHTSACGYAKMRSRSTLRQQLTRSLGSLAPDQGIRSGRKFQAGGYRNGRSSPKPTQWLKDIRHQTVTYLIYIVQYSFRYAHAHARGHARHTNTRVRNIPLGENASIAFCLKVYMQNLLYSCK